MKEKMRDGFYSCKDKATAQSFAYFQYEKLKDYAKRYQNPSVFDPLKTFFKTLLHSVFTDGIFEYFKDPVGQRYTNAMLEGCNARIKTLNRVCNGLTFEMLQARVLYGSWRNILVEKLEEKQAVTMALSFFDSQGYGGLNIPRPSAETIRIAMSVVARTWDEVPPELASVETPEDYEEILSNGLACEYLRNPLKKIKRRMDAEPPVVYADEGDDGAVIPLVISPILEDLIEHPEKIYIPLMSLLEYTPLFLQRYNQTIPALNP